MIEVLLRIYIVRYGNANNSKIKGIVYTPSDMADYLSEQLYNYLGDNIQEDSFSILDPAIGNGQLVLSLLNLIYQKIGHNHIKIEITVYDIDEQSLNSTKSLILTYFPNVKLNLICDDFLSCVSSINNRYDFIIANPPYVRTQILGSKVSKKIADNFSLSGCVDIYYAFLVSAKLILKPRGIAGYITSNKFLTIKSGQSLRNYMLHNYQILKIIDFGDIKPFKEAVLPCILIFKLGQTREKDFVKFISIYRDKEGTQEATEIRNLYKYIEKKGIFEVCKSRYRIQHGFLSSKKINEPWVISIEKNEQWLKKVSQETWLKFSQIGKIKVGIKTTADNVFIGAKNDQKFSQDIELLYPLVTHRNAGQIIPNNKDLWQVLYPYKCCEEKRVVVDIDDYPKSKIYLEKYYNQLSSREYLKKANRRWYEIWVPHNPIVWKKKKIIFKDISEHPCFWLDDSGAIVNGDCYWIEIYDHISEDIIYLTLGIANSHFIEKFYDLKFNTKLYSNKRRFMSQYVEQFPIPNILLPQSQQIIDLVKCILARKENNYYQKYMEKINILVDSIFS